MFAPLKDFGPTVWLVIIATLLSRFVAFMVFPFMAIILNARFGLNELEVGIFLAIPFSIGISSGFLIGYLSDLFGRRRIILAGICLNILAMVGLALADSVMAMMVGVLVQSISRSAVESPGKALMTDMLKRRAAKDLALQARYFALNVGAAVGPLAGARMGLSGQQFTFFLVAGIYGLYLVAALFVFRIEQPLKHTKMASTTSLPDVLRVLRRDGRFLAFVAASLIAFTAYGQIDSGLVQYLRVSGIQDIVSLYATLILINGATIIIFQFPLLKLTEKMNPLDRIALGAGLFVLAFAGLALSPPDALSLLGVAIFVLSVGEVIMFPTMAVAIDRMAPDDLKGSYYGAAQIGSFGFATAPLLGGFLLQALGGASLWITMIFLSLLSGGIFMLVKRNERARRGAGSPP